MVKLMAMPWATHKAANAGNDFVLERLAPNLVNFRPTSPSKPSIASRLKRATSKFLSPSSRPKSTIYMPQASFYRPYEVYEIFHDTSRSSSEDTKVESYPGRVSSPPAYVPHRLQCDPTPPSRKPSGRLQASTFISHSRIERLSSPTPEPNTLPSYGPTRPKTTDPATFQRMRSISRSCISCGLQHWQCANAGNASGRDFNKSPKLTVQVEDRDYDRLADYVRRRTEKIPNDDSAERKYVTLYLMDRIVMEKRVELRVAIEKYAERKGTELVIRACEAKRAEILYHFGELIESVKAVGWASAYMVDEKHAAMFGVVILR